MEYKPLNENIELPQIVGLAYKPLPKLPVLPSQPKSNLERLLLTVQLPKNKKSWDINWEYWEGNEEDDDGDYWYNMHWYGNDEDWGGNTW